MKRGRKLRYNAEAPSAQPRVLGFIARPDGAPVYHGFDVLPETETDGWVFGAISDYDCAEPQDEGDGFVIAPDGSRAGIAWGIDTPPFYEICPPDDSRWGVYGVCFPRSVSNLDDLVFNFRSILPLLQAKYEQLHQDGV